MNVRAETVETNFDIAGIEVVCLTCNEKMGDDAAPLFTSWQAPDLETKIDAHWSAIHHWKLHPDHTMVITTYVPGTFGLGK